MGLDLLLGEAKLMSDMGRASDALERLRPTLDDAKWIEPGTLRGNPVIAAVFVRAMATRAELAHEVGSSEAASWARVVEQLWADGEPMTNQVRDRMREIRSGSTGS